MTLYLESVMNTAKTFALGKAASAVIAFYQKINLFDHEPMQSPAVCVVRGAAMQKFGLNPNNQKEPFAWGKVVDFCGSLRGQAPRVLSRSGRDDGGRHVRRDVPL